MNESDRSQEESRSLSQEPSSPREEKPRPWHQRDFWMGVGLFFALNAIFLIVISALSANGLDTIASYLGFVALVINLALFIYLARERPIMAAGILFSFVFLFFLGLCAGIFLIATCFQAFSS